MIRYQYNDDGSVVSYRQGDCLLLAIASIDPATRAAMAVVGRGADGRITLLEGEVTGHAHAIADRGADLYTHEQLEGRFLQVLAEGGVSLIHEEHSTINLPPGDYEQRRQVETFQRETRAVSD